ncbi:hypothetical protein H6F74_10655 [Trichocoleus sp. FACHB-90]|uniref:hypothetical protein n=1 Tax=Cyanophyceae TaxID=3028117 RepID=UPI001688D56A|nr:hypothetical protein [Trichocoleus sp. FACHB-90]MBD1926700.1 hypothetical protein [Trichocoleus sp. FACHB-90]
MGASVVKHLEQFAKRDIAFCCISYRNTDIRCAIAIAAPRITRNCIETLYMTYYIQKLMLKMPV